MHLYALTEPTPGATKKIDELRTQKDEEDFIVQTDAGLKKANADKARIRALMNPCGFWKKLFGRCSPAGGGT
jgi:hypothetical protein